MMYQPTALRRQPVLVEVVVAEEELRLVDAVVAVVDADDVELPGRCRCFGCQIVAWIGIASPIFQPYRSARSRPTSAPCRSASQAFIWSGGTLNSG